jgi:hypothetical protein
VEDLDEGRGQRLRSPPRFTRGCPQIDKNIGICWDGTEIHSTATGFRLRKVTLLVSAVKAPLTAPVGLGRLSAVRTPLGGEAHERRVAGGDAGP